MHHESPFAHGAPAFGVGVHRPSLVLVIVGAGGDGDADGDGVGAGDGAGTGDGDGDGATDADGDCRVTTWASSRQPRKASQTARSARRRFIVRPGKSTESTPSTRSRFLSRDAGNKRTRER